MLHALEKLFDADLKALLGDKASLVLGVALPAPTAAKPAVCVSATRLETGGAGDEAGGARGPAHQLRAQTLTALAGQPTTFKLPAGYSVADVQAPPGRLLNAADHYVQQGQTLQFLTPPPAPVLARLRGDAARGYTERQSASIELLVTVWAASGAVASALSGEVVGAVLARFSDTSVIDLVTPGEGPLALRLYRPLAWPARVESTLQRLGASDWPCVTVLLAVRGELELALGVGAPDPVSRIEHIEYQTQVQPGFSPG
ncbi:hypothetical protein [Chitinolyticbacter albus]|uniref:hypothetical protein n=1 Tax=Chitinolyticbacter albus TaxID=2961951 RepID=UPI0021097DFF|nr:hypothetical protein [Chitinolyticbacter albus]